MVVVLHRTQDGTQATLERLRAEGLPLVIRTDGSAQHRQAEALTEELHDVLRTSSCDWLLPLDADEFLCSAEDIGRVLRSLPTDMASLLPWRTYVPTPADDAAEPNVLRRIVHRRDREQPQFWKVLIPAQLARDARARILPGSHGVVDATGGPLPVSHATDLWLSHFPVRSEQQLRCKVVAGWLSSGPTREAQRQEAEEDHESLGRAAAWWRAMTRWKAPPRPGTNFQWERLFDRCTDRASIGPEELRDLALGYASLSRITPSLIRDPVTTAVRAVTPVPSSLDPWALLENETRLFTAD
jgi:hypothetical protein